MTLVYEIQRWGGARIFALEATRSTLESVWVCGRRRARTTRHTQYFDSWDEAYAALLRRAEEEVAAARLKLDKANVFLGNVKGMVKP